MSRKGLQAICFGKINEYFPNLSTEPLYYSDNKGIVATIFKGAKNAINALKRDIHVQYMVTGAKLQMQGVLSQSDTIAAFAGTISNILKCVEEGFTAEAMTYLEQHLTAEKGSRFLEVVRKLEKELGDKKTQLDTAKAKRIVESLDDGKSVDDVVAELKTWCESGNANWYNPDGSINYPPNNGAVVGTEKIISLKPGDTLGRYGKIGPKSNFVTQPGVDASKLSLPPNTDPVIYQEFLVIKEIPGTIRAEIAAWGDSLGGGIQYELPMSIRQLLREGYIIPK